jgi:hypothetical protein
MMRLSRLNNELPLIGWDGIESVSKRPLNVQRLNCKWFEREAQLEAEARYAMRHGRRIMRKRYAEAKGFG